MYILEILLKSIIERNNKKVEPQEEREYAKCQHIFLPIDSSGKRLACSKCGQYAVLE